MRKYLALLAALVLVILLVLGCTKQNYNYPTGQVAYGGQQNPQSQGYVGGGCGVAGPDLSDPLDVSEPRLAA
jgi:hypothetical protein